jgi:hypothetical protein
MEGDMDLVKGGYLSDLGQRVATLEAQVQALASRVPGPVFPAAVPPSKAQEWAAERATLGPTMPRGYKTGDE